MKLTKKILKEMVEKELKEAFGDGGSFGAPSGAPGVSRQGKLMNALSNCQKNPEDPGCPKDRGAFKRAMAADAERAKKAEAKWKEARNRQAKLNRERDAKAKEKEWSQELKNRTKKSGFADAVRELSSLNQSILFAFDNYIENKTNALKAMISGTGPWEKMDKEAARLIFDGVYGPKIEAFSEHYRNWEMSLQTNAGAYMAGMIPYAVRAQSKMPEDMSELIDEFKKTNGEAERLASEKRMFQDLDAVIKLHQSLPEEGTEQPKKKGALGRAADTVKGWFGFEESMKLSSDDLRAIVQEELVSVLKEKKK